MRLKELVLAHPLFYRLVSSRVDRGKLQAIKRLRDDFSGLKVLDLGCGIGNSAKLFTESDYTGIDINRSYIQLAARKYPGLRFIAGDANRADWGDGFDIILINSFLHHLDDREALEILNKSAAALKSDGKIIIQEPLLPRENEWSCRLMMKLDRGGHFRSLSGWKKLFEQAGLWTGDIFFYSLRMLGIEGYKMFSISLGRSRPENFHH